MIKWFQFNNKSFPAMPDQKIIDKILQAILKVITPDKVILFGSQARGDARPDSDYDILVIAKNIESSNKIEGDIYMNMDLNASVDVIVATPEIVEEYKNAIGCIIAPAINEGVIIYGK